MKAFTIEVQRANVARFVTGFGVLAFLVRIVMGVSDQPVLFGVSIGGYKEFTVFAFSLAALLLLWDIRDKMVR